MPRKLAILCSLFCLWLAALAICTNIPTAPGPIDPPEEPPPVTPLAATSLPIEVLGENGTIRSITLVVTNGNTADNLWFQVHNLSFEGKMSIRVNGGSWVTFTDSDVTYPDREFAMYGMGGISSTLRFHWVIDGGATLYNGTNTFEFRFNDDSASKTIGYRVLAFNARAGTNNLIAASQFDEDDPADWEQPSTAPEDVEDGRDAWLNLTIQERGTNIVAKCTDCHTWNGRDLKYFNYSNKSIIARSIFHNVPANRATNIASYIRSLDVPYSPSARPWNPPYQPKPGTSDASVYDWAAGGGLDWVMENGTNAFAYLFPDGITTNRINLSESIAARDIPLVIPFPDWNTWLPKVHPFDQDNTFFSTNRFTQIYYDIRNGITNKTGFDAAYYFEGRKNAWDSAGSLHPPGQTEEWLRDQRHWRALKTWEMMTEFQIEDFGAPSDGVFSAPANGAEIQDRRWFHGEVFRMGPHVIGLPHDDRFYWESAQWYQLQLVLNDGNRLNGSIVPIDWGYQHALNQSAWNNPGSFPSYDALVLNVIKGLEVGHNGRALGISHAFDPRQCNVFRLEGQYYRPFMNAMPAEFRKAIVEAVGSRWADELEAYTTAEFVAAGWTSGTKGNDFKSHLNMALTWWPLISVDAALIARIQAKKDALFP